VDSINVTQIEESTGAEVPPAVVQKRTNSGRRKKNRSEMMKKHRTWHQGYPVYLESDSTEDEMIASIEEFIKKYVEQALDAEYFTKLTLNTSIKKNEPCGKVEIKDVSRLPRPKSPIKKKGSLIRRLRDTLARSNPGSKSNSFDEGISPQSMSTATTSVERRKKFTGVGAGDQISRSSSVYSREEEDMMLDDIERRLIEQVNKDMSVPLADLLLMDR